MLATKGHSIAPLHGGPGADRPVRALGASDTVSWAGMALPLTACAAIWGIGDASPAGVAWLSAAHGVIGTAASAWTVIQLAKRRRSARQPRSRPMAWPRPSLLALYGLLGLQPMLAVMASMLHGDKATLFGIPLPSVLASNLDTAVQVDRLHAGNALLLLALIAWHIRNGLRSLRLSQSVVSGADS